MFKLNFSKYTFQNNLRFIEVPYTSSGALTILVLVRAGSRFEKDNIAGIAHFLEHMFFKGGKKYKNAKEVSEAIDKVGGLFNASTDKEEVAYFIKLPGPKAQIALDVLSDMLLDAQFRKNDIEMEKNVVIEEIKMYEDTPMFQTAELLESILYKDNSLGRKIVGFKETVKNLSQKTLLRYIKSFYSPENMVIIAAGDTSFISKEEIANFFSFSKRKNQSIIKKPREIQAVPQSFIKFKETEQTHLSLGFRFPEATFKNKDFFAAKVLNTVLGEGMSSRIFLAVREKKGLAYRVNSFGQSFTDTGYIEVSAGVDNKKVKKAISAILLEIKKLKEKKVGEIELQKAKEYLKGKLIIELENSLNAAFHIGRQELLQGNILPLPKILGEIDKVNYEDISHLANKNFQNEKLNLAVIGPFKNKEEFNEVLNV